MAKWRPVEITGDSSSEGLVLFEELCFDKDIKPKKLKTKIVKKKVINLEDEVDLSLIKSTMGKWTEHYQLSNELLSALYLMGYKIPTEIQKLGLKTLKSDNDIIYSAETGSGKTIAYGISLATKLDDNKHGIVLVPTRELAVQVYKVIKSLLRYTKLRVVCIVGGFYVEKQKRLLSSPFNIIVATPGRLVDMMETEESIKSIKLQILVFDEADRFSDTTNMKDLEKLLNILLKYGNVKKILCSATIPSEHSDISKYFKLKNPILCKVEGKIVPENLVFKKINMKTSDKEFVLFQVILSNLIGENKKIIVFMKTISHVKRIHSIFKLLFDHNKVKTRFSADVITSIHSKLQQRSRIKNLDRFLQSKKGILFATDVAARGIDFPFVDIVIQFNPPNNTELLIHRSGRTARAGRYGVCISFVSEDNIKEWERFFSKIGKKLSQIELLTLKKKDFLTKIWKQTLLVEQLEHQESKRARSSLSKIAIKADLIVSDDEDDDSDGGDVSKLSRERKKLQGWGIMAYNRNMGDNPKPICLANIPDDSISSIRWSNPPNSLFIAAGSWDRSIRLWQVSTSFGSNLNSTFKASYVSNAPVLSIGFSQDNTKIFAGSCDNTIKMFDLSSGNQAGVVVGQHQKPVIGVYHSPQQNVVVSGGWDGMVAIWDMRQQNPAWTRMLNSKIFAMDVKSNLICTADSKLRANYWNMNNLNDTNTIPLDSSLRTQVRALALFPEGGDEVGAGFTSIGGRCVVNYFSASHRARNFSFKCHRTDLNGKGTYVYPVNSIDFYGKYGTFVTGGGDGNFTIWDKENKTRVKMFTTMDSPIVDVKFNSCHNLLAYATSYDWHKGMNRNLMNSNRSLQIVQLREEDVKPKPKAGTNRR